MAAISRGAEHDPERLMTGGRSLRPEWGSELVGVEDTTRHVHVKVGLVGSIGATS